MNQSCDPINLIISFKALDHIHFMLYNLPSIINSKTKSSSLRLQNGDHPSNVPYGLGAFPLSTLPTKCWQRSTLAGRLSRQYMQIHTMIHTTKDEMWCNSLATQAKCECSAFQPCMSYFNLFTKGLRATDFRNCILFISPLSICALLMRVLL